MNRSTTGFLVLFLLVVLVNPSVAQQTSFRVWGNNEYGQLGDGTTFSQWVPEVISSDGYVMIAAGGEVSNGGDHPERHEHSLVLKDNGTVWSCGYNGHGQLGLDNTSNSSTFKQAQGLTNVIAISAGGEHSLALKSDGTVWAWGLNWAGQAGRYPETYYDLTTPKCIIGLTSVKAIFTGTDSSFFVKYDGTVWGIGNDGNGQLGDGQTRVNRYDPIQAIGINNIVEIAAGKFHTVALKSDGTVWAFGSNGYGQLGLGTIIQANTPTKIPNLDNVIAISAGEYHSLALKSNGTVWAFGGNWSGQLGIGTTTKSLVPVQTQGLTNIRIIEAGSNSSFAINKAGQVWAWGDNYYCQFGNGSYENASSPVKAFLLPSIKSISSGLNHSMLLARSVYTVQDIKNALRLSAGLSSSSLSGIFYLDSENVSSGRGKVNIADAIAIARLVCGVDTDG